MNKKKLKNNVNSKKFLRFDIASDNIKIRNLLTQQFLSVEINCISDAFPNRNNSYFTPQAMVNAMGSFKNKPILCHYIPNEDNYGAHDTTVGPQMDFETGIMYEDYSKDAEVPIGVIPESSEVKFYNNEEDGLNWLSCTAVLWVAYNYKAVKKLLKSKATWVSVEVEVLDSEEDENGIEHIKEFSLLGITMLHSGGKYLPAIPNAQLKVTDYEAIYSSEKFTTQFNKIKFAYEEINKFNSSSSEKPNWEKPIENEEPIEEITFDDIKDNKKNNKKNNKKENNINNITDSKDNIDSSNNNNINNSTDKKDFNSQQKEKFKKGEVMPMTYQAKMDIIFIALKAILKYVWFYINDIDDEYVYFTTENNDIIHKAPYKIEEGGAFVDIDKQEKVVRSWQTYTKMDNNKKDFDVLVLGDVEANTKAHIVHDDEKAGIDLKMAKDDEKDVEKESTEKCEKEECETQEKCTVEDECKMSDKEECAKEECGMSDNKGGDSSGDGKKSGKTTESKEECDCDCDEHKEEEAVEDECKMSDKEECAKEVEQSTVQQPPIISQDTYSDLMCRFTALQKEHEVLMSEYKTKVQNEQLKFAQDFVNTEKDLCAESAKNVFSVIETAIKAEKFSSCEEVEKFATQEIATTLYMDKKNGKVNDNKDTEKNNFSYNIQKTSKVSGIYGFENDVDELKKVNEKLKYL